MKPDYWIDIYNVLTQANWDKKPSAKYRPLVFADKPLTDERVMELFEESGRKPLVFAKLIQHELGIREFEMENR